MQQLEHQAEAMGSARRRPMERHAAMPREQDNDEVAMEDASEAVKDIEYKEVRETNSENDVSIRVPRKLKQDLNAKVAATANI